MTTPVGGIDQAAQIAQQQMQKAEATQKSGASKFDQAMASKAEATSATQHVNSVDASQKVDAAQKTRAAQTIQSDKVQKADSLEDLQKSRAAKRDDPVTKSAESQKGTPIQTLLEDMEGRNASMEKFINKAIAGKLKLDQQQLLGLQAKVSQYSLELDLTGKVVEKATNGLKETLKTQV